MPRAARVNIREEVFQNFSGGLNTRDESSELGQNEFPYSNNVTIDERGQVTKRLGYTDKYGSAIGTGLVSNLFYWKAQNKLIHQIGAGVHADGASAFHTWSTSDRAGYCEFMGNLMMIHPVDGLKAYDGSTVTTPTNAPKGNTCFPWQNKLWCGGDPTTNQLARLYYSDIASPNRTNTNQFNDIREKDSTAITCIVGAAGQDISGRPGLLVCKADSTYRVYDSSNGAYNTIDASVGCGSNIGAVSAYGRTFVANTRGIWSSDGLEPFREQTQLVSNFFASDQVNQTRPDLYCAGRWQDRLYFSFPKAGQTANTQVFEIHPIQNWLVPHTNAASAYANLGTVTDMVFGSPANNGRIYTGNTGGSDNGASIASAFQTNWMELNGGNIDSVRRARFTGYGAFTARPLVDFEITPSRPVRNISMFSTAGTWNNFNWNDGSLWGPVAFQTHQNEWSIGHAREIAWLIEETSTLTRAGRPILAGASTPTLGAWTLSSISMLCIDTGNY